MRGIITTLSKECSRRWPTLAEMCMEEIAGEDMRLLPILEFEVAIHTVVECSRLRVIGGDRCVGTFSGGLCERHGAGIYHDSPFSSHCLPGV